MIRLEEMEQLLATFKSLPEKDQKYIMKYKMGSVLNPEKPCDCEWKEKEK